MNRNLKFLLPLCCLTLAGGTLCGQSSGEGWTLRECIDYARENNINVQSSQVSLQSSLEDAAQARARRLPSLGFSTGQNFVNRKNEREDGSFEANGTYSGNYALNAEITVYNGGKLKHSLRQQELVGKRMEYEVSVARNDIEIAVTQAYLEILYANETLKTDLQTLESSGAQLRRAKELYEAGSIALSDYAQIESQYSSDKYQVTAGESALAEARLQLKQLLELGVDDDFDVIFPDLDSVDVMQPVPALKEVYAAALELMPEIRSGRLNVESSELGEKIAEAERLPSLSANASIGTGNISGTNYSFYNQLNNELNESVGLTLSVPIFNNRSARTAVNKARLQTRQAELDMANTEKELLRTVESLYQDARSAQSNYLAATDKLKASALSYSLVEAQFNAGIKNTVELLTEKNNFLAAQQEQLQAKYQAVLSIKLLKFYQNEAIEL